MTTVKVPFFRPDVGAREIDEVTATLQSGWLTTGPKAKAFEEAFKAAVNASHALAVNSCTAALHLAVDALGAAPGQAVLVPTLTFAATAEVVRYQGAIPVLVDCDPFDLNLDLTDAGRKLHQLDSGRPPAALPQGLSVAGLMPVHVGGTMMDIDAIQVFAARHRLWVVEDAAHAFPAAWRRGPADPWQQCGEGTASISCFSFYANKTITTGEGGMLVADDASLAERTRLMALHGLSTDAWQRYSGTGSWDYKIIAPGFKYNLTDIAAALGIHQLARAEQMRVAREQVGMRYLEALEDVAEIELPRANVDRVQSWHLFPIKLRLDTLSIDRAAFIRELRECGISCSVHWRPLHLHPYYRETFGWRPEDCPVATAVWERLVSLPIFSAMREEEIDGVIESVRRVCARFARHRPQPATAVSDVGGAQLAPNTW
jgi:dTDP-4-amino-4,6-dideoxygalactose transaminase